MRYSFHAATFHTATARVLVAVCCCTLLWGLAATSAHADAVSEGNVVITSDGGATFTADNPLTGVNEGIPTGGNTINENQGLNNQLNFEGRTDTKGTATIADDENVNFDIIVGRTSYGLLTINAGTELRDMNLVIGATGTLPGSPAIRRGTGIVIIENPGSLYNNDSNILPFPFDVTGVSPSINDRIDEPGADMGFDLCVGHTGSGDLVIRLGGRAEIQDAVYVGDESGGIGTLSIDGIGSFLQSGGFETTTTNPDIINYMVVGRLGSGTMSITNGGQSYNSGPLDTSAAGSQTFAAVIGSNLAAVDNAAPGAGGEGTVYVDGIGSKWTLAGNLQVGAFHDDRIGVFPIAMEDLDGRLANYHANVGRGTLKVSNGGLVSIVSPPLDVNASNAPNRLDLLVGEFGRVELDGGRIELLGAFDNSDPQNPTQEIVRGRLINDGFVGGTGSVSVLQFRNRVLGEVRVNAGQTLTIESTGAYSQPDNIPLNTEPEEYPLSNYGVIKALGTVEARANLEFSRNQTTPPLPTDITRPFLNLPLKGLPIAPNGRTEGLIHAEYATLKFKSGLWNRGVLAFTKGNNVVSGDVVSFGDSAPGANDRGRVLIGPDTNVAFEDDFFTFGTTQISPGATFQVLKGNSFAVGGTYSMSVTATANGLVLDSPSPLITGNASFSGDLQVSISGGFNLTNPVAIPIFNVGGTISGNFTQVTPSGLPFGSDIDLFTFVFGQQLYLAAFDVGAANGPDLNGDGQIDNADYAIWKQNFGTAGPAGDANGDGIVDAADYNLWRDNCCGPFPGAGSGSGFPIGLGSGSSAVPEPASALLMLGSVLALAMQRRRRS